MGGLVEILGLVVVGGGVEILGVVMVVGRGTDSWGGGGGGSGGEGYRFLGWSGWGGVDFCVCGIQLQSDTKGNNRWITIQKNSAL